MPHEILSRRNAFVLLCLVVLAWGSNWPMTKMIVQEMPPLWATALRCGIAAAVLGLLLWMRGEFIVPKRGDLPVVFSASLLHMAAYSALIAAGLQFLPAGRAVVLGYTTPIWVAIGAPIFLSERLTMRKLIGVDAGLVGLGVIFSPGSLDWSDRNAVFGSALIMFAAFCWAANIIYVRAHKWISSPFQLVFWQLLLACLVLSTVAMLWEGIPHVAWTPRLVALLLLSAVFSTALGHWAMTVVNRSLPAVTTSCGLLATPAVGIISGIVVLGEPFELSLLAALALLTVGIAVGTGGDAGKRPANGLSGRLAS